MAKKEIIKIIKSLKPACGCKWNGHSPAICEFDKTIKLFKALLIKEINNHSD